MLTFDEESAKNENKLVLHLKNGGVGGGVGGKKNLYWYKNRLPFLYFVYKFEYHHSKNSLAKLLIGIKSVGKKGSKYSWQQNACFWRLFLVFLDAFIVINVTAVENLCVCVCVYIVHRPFLIYLFFSRSILPLRWLLFTVCVVRHFLNVQRSRFLIGLIQYAWKRQLFLK